MQNIIPDQYTTLGLDSVVPAQEGRRYRLRLPAHADLGPGQGPAHRHACLRALALLPGA